MKQIAKIFASLLFVLMVAQTASAQAQIGCLSRGNFVLGTRLGLSTAKTDVETSGTANVSNAGSRSFQYTLTPSVGYLFADNFTFGIGMDWTGNGVKSDKNTSTASAVDEKNSTLLFGPYARYYLPIGDDNAFFLGGVSGFGRSNNEFDVDGQRQKIENNISSIGFGPGYTIFSNDCIAIETQLKYNWGRSKNTTTLNGVTNTQVTNSTGFDFVVGFSYYLTRPH